MYLKGAIASAFILFLSQFSNAQQSTTYLQEVLVPEVDTTLSQMVVGTYDYQAGVYERFDTLAGGFTNDAVVDEDTLYINAGTMGTNENIIYKYNIGNRQLMDTLHVKGAKSFGIKDDHLIVAKGFPLSGNFVDIYDKRDFSQQFSGDTLDNYGSNVAIDGDYAYVGRDEAFSDPEDTAKIFVYDLLNHTFDREIVLDTFVKAVDQVYASGNFLYAFGNGYLTTYDLSADTFATKPVSPGSSCFGNPFLGLANDKIFYGTAADSIFSYDTGNETEALVNDYGSCFNTGVFDTLNDQFVVTRTDFGSYGNMKFVDRSSGAVSDSLSLGHSNESLALHYKSNIGPVVANDYDTTLQGQTLQVDVLANDSDPDGDSLTLSIANNPSNGSASVNAGKMNYTADSNFSGMDTLTYEVCDVSPASLCEQAQLFVQVDSMSTGIQTAATTSGFDVYPNPAVSRLHINTNDQSSSDKHYEIINLKGQTVSEGRMAQSENSISVSSLQAGVYFLRVRQQQTVHTQKVVIE